MASWEHYSVRIKKGFIAAFMKGDRPLAGVMAKSLRQALHEKA